MTKPFTSDHGTPTYMRLKHIMGVLNGNEKQAGE